jgi:aspartyl aminopeptidase
MSEEKSKGQILEEKLTKKWDFIWEKVDEKEEQAIYDFSTDYMKFLDAGKTERLAAAEVIRQAEAMGYEPIEAYLESGKKPMPGTKIYANNRGKAVVLFHFGQKPLEEGMQIVGAHLDAPRIDLKAFPLYEDGGLGLLKTHYYGGVRKYQWVALPLALHGTVVKRDGTSVEVSIGEKADEPVFMISDLLPHLAKDQNQKKLHEGIAGEELNIIIGSVPFKDDKVSKKIKLNLLNILNKKYDIDEADFVTAEFEAVPAGQARDLGLDRSLIAAHGHDDRVCSYTGMKAVFEAESPVHTAVALLVDKEEIGSYGNTGMDSKFFEFTVAELLGASMESYNDLALKRALRNSKALSADVNAGFDPTFPSVMDPKNSSYLGKGVVLTKYTGSRGKGGCNDANAEFVGEVRNIFEENAVIWQTGELGKVDQGGGGTIAFLMAAYDMDVIDCGVPVLSMHAPYEIVSKADVYMTYKGYKAFVEA